VAERFIRTIKVQTIHVQGFRDLQEVREVVGDFMPY
jgi:hypothetical protein